MGRRNAAREPPPGLADSTREALISATCGQERRAIESIADIAGWGPQGVHAALCGWSAISLEGLGEGDAGRPGYWYLEVTDSRTGDVVAIDQPEITPAERDAARLVSLYGNDDHSTIIAIVHAHWDTDCCAGLMVASVRMAAGVARSMAEGTDGS